MVIGPPVLFFVPAGRFVFHCRRCSQFIFAGTTSNLSAPLRRPNMAGAFYA
jgi:hypothetical protein